MKHERFKETSNAAELRYGLPTSAILKQTCLLLLYQAVCLKLKKIIVENFNE